MGIATYDALVNALSSGQFDDYPWWKTMPTGVAGGIYSAWPQTGQPPAGAYAGTALNAQQCSRTTTGGFGWANVSGKTRHLRGLQGFCPTANGTGFITVLDRLLYYPGINANSNAAQSLVNGVALSRYTNGVGVQAFFEVTVALGATPANATLTYTDDAGNTGQSTGAQAMIVSSVAGRLPHAFHFFPLAAGDFGLRSVQTVQFSAAMAAGSVALVLAKKLAVLPIPTVGQWSILDLVAQLPSLPQIQDDACLMFLACWSAAPTTPTLQGDVNTVYN